MTRYRYNKLTHKKEQVQCPYCGSTNIKKIVYGMLPSYPGLAEELAAAGEIGGGCCVRYLKYYCADCEQDFNIVDKPEGTDYRERLEVKEEPAPIPPPEPVQPYHAKPPSLLSRCITALVYLAILYALVWYLGWDQAEGWLEKLVHVVTKMLGV
jgi:DNA-directed RNA polymerase subunit RPC12/RpoP